MRFCAGGPTGVQVPPRTLDRPGSSSWAGPAADSPPGSSGRCSSADSPRAMRRHCGWRGDDIQSLTVRGLARVVTARADLRRTNWWRDATTPLGRRRVVFRHDKMRRPGGVVERPPCGTGSLCTAPDAAMSSLSWMRFVRGAADGSHPPPTNYLPCPHRGRRNGIRTTRYKPQHCTRHRSR